jgi:hypothetical protein
VIQPPFDPVDIVTEVINRVEQALESATTEGPGRVTTQATTYASAAVA